MALFPIHRPRIGLSFTSSSLSLVELRRTWRPGWRRAQPRRVAEQILPRGLLCPSDTTPNIADVSLFVKEVQTLVGHAKGVPVALSLPDQCAQIGLFEFDSLPQPTAEREALLRWRFREEFNAGPGDTRLAFRVFRTASVSGKGKTSSAPTALVLAASIRRDILDQYEQVCEEAGILPVELGFASLQLFDLCLAAFKKSQEVFFAYRSSDGLIFLAIRNGLPIYLRTKLLRSADINLVDELTGTLQFYDDHIPHKDLGVDIPPGRLFVIGDGLMTDGQSGTDEDKRNEPLLLCPTSNPGWRVEVIRLGWADLPVAGKKRLAYPESALSALAGLAAA